MRLANGVASYRYNGDGLRTVVDKVDGSRLVQIYGNNGKLMFGKTSARTTDYIFVGEKLIAEIYDVGTSGEYIHTDILGSRVARSSASGVVNSPTRYEPYGKTAAGTNPNGPGFTGHVNDQGTGLVYMQQRYYDPIAGRFLSVDPVATDAKSGGHFNRYNYACNNPCKYVDPDGERGVAGAIYGAIAGGTGGYVASGSSATQKIAGTVAGAVAGAIVGLALPEQAGTVGTMAAGVVASALGQAAGSGLTAAADKGVTNVTGGDIKVDGTTTVLGGLGAGAGSLVGKGVAGMTQGKIIGVELSKAGAPTAAGLTAGAVVEGATIGLAKKATDAVKAAGEAIKSFFTKD